MENHINTAKHIRLLVTDVDGVMNDGQVYFSPTGEYLKPFHVHDGFGLKLLMRHQIQVAVITMRHSAMLVNRCNELGIQHIFQNAKNKLIPFQRLLKQLDISADQTAYVGDDLPDLPCVLASGFGIAVQNACNELKAKADWITSKAGGEGALREIAEFLLKAQNKWDDIKNFYLNHAQLPS